MPAPKPNTSERDRYWARRAHRVKAGWPADKLNVPPESRVNRDSVYHRAVDMVYEDPALTSADIAVEIGVSAKVVRNALGSRHTTMSEVRAEALEEVRF